MNEPFSHVKIRTNREQIAAFLKLTFKFIFRNAMEKIKLEQQEKFGKVF